MGQAIFVICAANVLTFLFRLVSFAMTREYKKCNLTAKMTAIKIDVGIELVVCDSVGNI